MTPTKPVEFTRDTQQGQQRCGNRVQIEDANGDAINAANPLDVNMATGAGNPVSVDVINPIADPVNVNIVSGAVSITVTEIADTPAITAGAYVANDALGDELEFPNAVAAAGGSGTITKVVIVDDADQLAPVDLVLFNQDFVETADNAPFDPSDADLQNTLGYIDVAATDYASFVDNAVAAKTSGLRMPFPFILAAGETSLRGQLVVRDAPTYAAVDDITVILTIEQNA